MLVGIHRLDAKKPFTQHLIARGRKKSTIRKTIIVSLMLTSMVDMFSLLVIFLLQTFSASPELALVTKGVVLPTSSTAQEIQDAPVLSLTNDGVFLDQKYVGKTNAVLLNPHEFMRRLEQLRELWQKTHPRDKFRGEISLQAHKDISSPVVAQFMAMLPSQHYSSIQLAVLGGSAR